MTSRIKLPHNDLAAHARWVAETISAPFTVPTRLPLLTKAPPPEPEPPQTTLLDLLDAMDPRQPEAAPAVEEGCPAGAEPGIWALLKDVVVPPSPLALKRKRLRIEREEARAASAAAEKAVTPAPAIEPVAPLVLTMDMGRLSKAHLADRTDLADRFEVACPPFHLHDEDLADPVDEFLGQVVGVEPARALLFRREDPDVLDSCKVGQRYVLLRFWDDKTGEVWNMPVEGEDDRAVFQAIETTVVLYRRHRTTGSRAA
ncbi:MAG: hypothetical protein WAP03_16050 [Methylorubrum rhodinum]|jgi:hypothetical protein|uniref:hypothetical protein n=1 Tax=Methylorubrum rhodinum TaxID=29428 RepID=UPI001055F4C6